jgi:membrane protease YdiL (CAAX protease family)
MAQMARRIRLWGVPEFTTGLAATLILMWLLVTWLRSASFPLFALGGNLALLFSYLVVWIPLLAACAFATYARGTRSLKRDLGLAITLTDIIFGLSVGLLARGLVSILEIVTTGRMGLGSVTLGEVVYNGWWVFGALLAPIVLAPFVEELFFRGLVLRSVTGLVPGRFAPAIAIFVSAMLFAALHLTQGPSPSQAIVLGFSTLILGIAAGILAFLTGRIGASIVAHAVFNATIIVAALTS